MPLPYSTTSIGSLPDFLGGQSAPCSGTQWDQLRSTEADASLLQPWVVARFHATVKSPGDEISVWLEATDETALKKIVGCWIIARLPDRALNEAIDALKEIAEFSQAVPKKSLPAPQRQPLAAVIGPTQRRHGFSFGD